MAKLSQLPGTTSVEGEDGLVVMQPDGLRRAKAFDVVEAALLGSAQRSGTFADRDAIPLDQRKRGLRFLVTADASGPFQEWREYEWRLAGDRDGPTREWAFLTAPQWCALYTEREKQHFDIVPFQGTLPAANVEQMPTALANIGELYQPRIYGFRAVALSTTSPLRAMLEWEGEADGFTLSWGNFSLPVGAGIRAIDTQAFDYDAVRPLLFTGDSMLDGTWAAGAAAELGRDAVVVAKYSSGAKQVYRLGVRKLFCTAAGNTIPASGTSVAVTSINGVAPSASAVGGNPSSFDLFAAHGFLNTSSGDTISTHCSEAGTWGGRHGVMSVPNGGTPSVSFTPDDGLGATPIDPQSPFVPDNLARLKTHEVTARLSQNYAFAGPGNPVFPNDINPRVLEDLQLIAAETVGQPFTVLGLSPQNNFTTGTPFYTALRYLNGTQANGYTDGQFYQLFGDRYAIVTVAGVKYNNSDYVRWFGRDGSANDQADYDADINPRSVMETTNPGEVHYNAKGEGLEKAFWLLWRQQRKRPPAITSSTLFTLVGTRTQPAIFPEEPVLWTSEPATAGMTAGKLLDANLIEETASVKMLSAGERDQILAMARAFFGDVAAAAGLVSDNGGSSSGYLFDIRDKLGRRLVSLDLDSVLRVADKILPALASDIEAVAGTRTDVAMSPAQTKSLVGTIASFALREGSASGYSVELVAGGRRLAGWDLDGNFIATIAFPELITARGTSASLTARLDKMLRADGLPTSFDQPLFAPHRLRETRRLMGQLRRGTALTQLSVAVIGDSWTDAARYYLDALAKQMLTWDGGVFGDAGPGYVSACKGGAGHVVEVANSDLATITLIGAAGTWDRQRYSPTVPAFTIPAPDMACSICSTVGNQIRLVVPAGAAAVSLLHRGGAGVVRYRLDGGVWTTLALDGANALEIKALTITGSPTLIEIEIVSGTCEFYGFDVRRSQNGVRFNKLGLSGTSSTQWVAQPAADWQRGFAQLAPNLTKIFLGTNDRNGLTTAQYIINIGIMIDRVRAAAPLSDILLVSPPDNLQTTGASLFDFDYALRALAETRGCAHLSLQPYFGTDTSAYGPAGTGYMIPADPVHVTDLGGCVVTEAISRVLRYS